MKVFKAFRFAGVLVYTEYIRRKLIRELQKELLLIRLAKK
jgi:hypothetical protein